MPSMNAALPILELKSSEAPKPLPGILDVPPEEFRAWLAERGQPPMRGHQVRRQILAGRADSFERMSDLPKELRAELGRSFVPFRTRVERHLVAADDTHKLVLRLHDDRMIECVLIQD